MIDIETENITQIIFDTINTLLSNLFSSIDNNIYPILDNLVFIDSNIIKTTQIEKILGNSTNGLLLITNSLLLGFILYYSVRFIFSHYIGIEVEKPIQFIIKALIFTIIMNFSLFFCEQLISFNSYISTAIKDVGHILFNKDICFTELINNLNSTLYLEDGNYNLFSVDGILKGFISFGILNLVLSYSLRYILIKIFILICPFAILTLITTSTSWFFKIWFKSFLSLLFLQIFISIILLIPNSILIDLNKNSIDIFSKLSLLASIYALTKANGILKEFMGGISTNIQSNLFSLKN